MGKYREIKVGAFVAAGLCAVGVVMFMIGEERQLFSKKENYQLQFQNVDGLRRGSTVQMGGLNVGAVDDVSYSQNPKDATIYVKVSVTRSESQRIRTNSVGNIVSKGLLGDKAIVISVGSPSRPQIPPGGVIPSEESQDLTAVLTRLGSVGDHVEKMAKNLEQTTGALNNPKLHEDLRSSVSSLSSILQSLDKGQGYAARFLHDPKEADRFSNTLANLERSSAELGEVAQRVNAVVGRVQSGPGLVHDVIYEKGPARAIEQFGGAADEMRLALKGIREGNGVARGLLYGDGSSAGGKSTGELLSNLTEMSGDLKQIVADVRAGKGTLGALLVDPSVYEDVKLLLGNVQRNQALRALVRYSIRRDQPAPKVEVRDPKPSGARGQNGALANGSGAGD
jgi:phospholipid/cholesterol/gamma-HCH transport system substrate-binding protein